MWKHLVIVCCLAAGCKTDSNEQPAGEPTGGAPAAPSGAKPRSGKIDLDRPQLPPAEGDDSSSEESENVDRTDDPAAWRQRRQERMARLDTDGDGKISEQERAVARQARAQSLRTRLDTDHDGKLTVEELRTSPLRRFDPDTADANGDGNVSVEELDTMLQNRGIGRRGPWGRRGGAGADPAGSGGPTAPSAPPAPTAPQPAPQ